MIDILKHISDYKNTLQELLKDNNNKKVLNELISKIKNWEKDAKKYLEEKRKNEEENERIKKENQEKWKYIRQPRAMVI